MHQQGFWFRGGHLSLTCPRLEGAGWAQKCSSSSPCCKENGPKMFLKRWGRNSPFRAGVAWMLLSAVPSKGKGSQAPQPAGGDLGFGKYASHFPSEI